MSFELTLFPNTPYIHLPADWTGWLGLLAMLGLTAVVLWANRKAPQRWAAQRGARKWTLLGILLVVAPFSGLLVVLRLPPGAALPPPGLPQEPLGAAILFLAALPLMLAAGFLGILPAAGVASLTGLAIAGWETHQLFTIVEWVLLACIIALTVQQRYRTLFYRWVRHPFVAALAAAFVYPSVYLFSALFSVTGTLAERLDYTLSHLQSASLATGAALLFAGLFCEAVARAFPQQWGGASPLQPSPVERSLQNRFLFSLAPLAVLLITTLMVSDWVVAGTAAQSLIRARMASTAQMAAEYIPFFIYTGKNLIKQMAADDQLLTPPASALTPILEEKLLIVPFFNQLLVVDAQGELIAASGEQGLAGQSLAEAEWEGVRNVLNGVNSLYTAIQPVRREDAAQVSFMNALRGSDGALVGVLIGRSDIEANPFTQPILASLNSIVEENQDGKGMLLDNRGQVIYDSTQAQIMQSYTGQTSEKEGIFYLESSPGGTRQMVYYQPAVGEPWAVVLVFPIREAQQLALTIAAPLLAVLLVLFIVAALLLRIGLKVVTASLGQLAVEANRIASGRLDHALAVDGDDEVGQTRRSFEQMRQSLKARLEDLNRLLLVSQGVAASLELEQALRPVLEAGTATGACAARITLEPAAVPELEGDAVARSFGLGHASDAYAGLDEQILALTRQQDRLVLTNLSRTRALTISPAMPRPDSVIAFSLRHENNVFGAFWLVYDHPRPLSEDEMRFLTTLSGQAALATANARLFLSAEIGRQRLAAILASTPDPVLVTDHHHRLLLANPAAWQVVGVGIETSVGQLVDKIIPQRDLARLLRANTDQKQSAEITFPNSKIYLATASSVMADGRRMGRVCVLRDVTHFKELDALKSEFVSTVSHDLRSPLTLMRGYATMLEMVGNLNEQQTGYVRKIVTSVETMSRLVNNLLDLGRIEAGVDLQLEMVPVHDIAERVTSALQLQATQKRIQLQMEMPPHTIPLVEADQSLLQQALHNMVENAIKYTEPGGKVTVRVSAREDKMTFEIADTGIGIAPVDLPRLFEKFYRAGQQQSKKQAGTGLGLAIVKSIAERHGGSVQVESQLGKGSIFTLAIPLRQPKRK